MSIHGESRWPAPAVRRRDKRARGRAVSQYWPPVPTGLNNCQPCQPPGFALLELFLCHPRAQRRIPDFFPEITEREDAVPMRTKSRRDLSRPRLHLKVAVTVPVAAWVTGVPVPLRLLHYGCEPRDLWPITLLLRSVIATSAASCFFFGYSMRSTLLVFLIAALIDSGRVFSTNA